MKTIKTLYIGSNWEAQETLEKLVKDKRFKIIGLITRPDKPVGRKREIKPAKIKVYAKSKNIPVFHTNNKEENYKKALEKFKPELIVCKSFGEIIPEFFLEAPKYKSINIHYSLLPKYRGAVPIQKAILEGDQKTGISIVKMVKELDAGEILEQYEEEIKDSDTNLSLRKRLVEKTGEVLPNILERLVEGDIKLKKQDNSKATYCWEKEIAKENAEIDWVNMDPEYIERMVRAFIPWPVAWHIVDGTRMQVYASEVTNYDIDLKPGEEKVHKDMLVYGTKDPNKQLRVLELQLAGKKKISESDYLNSLKG